MFRAHDPLMNRIVAVKVLTATEDAGSLNRFKNEATSAGNLHHKNIVTVHEFGQEGNVPFLVMEYLEGEDLQDVIAKQAPLSLYQKVHIMDQIADGLHCAHVNGVLHRDVKPANIMVLKAGGVKIMDFGIARLVRDSSTRLTQHGYLVGTVVYMAPELFSGEMEVDALCDIWSYGVVMYELLSGKNPFRTGSLQSEMYRIVHQDPSPLPPEVCPHDLQAVISRLLSRPRGLRYQTLEETRFDLQPILNNLKKAEADRHVAVAQQLMFDRKWASALDAAREARQIDPQNGTARIIFERIQQELRKQSMHPRVDELLRRSSQAAEQKNLPEAIHHLEAVLQIDSTNEKALIRLHELRGVKAKLDAAATLVSEADERLHAGRLTEAFARASEAVALDPDNQEWRRLFESIQRAMREKEAQAELEAEILRARGLIAIDDLDGAMDTLKAADSNYPGDSMVRNLIVQVSGRLSDRERRLEFSRRLDRAKDAVRGGRFNEAIADLEQLLEASPQEAEVTDLLAYAKQEWKARERSKELKRITDAAADLNRKQEFCQAIQILEDSRKRFPDDLSLTRLLRSTYAELQNAERESAKNAGLQRCEELRRNRQWQEALCQIALLLSDNPNDRELMALDLKITQEKDQAERTSAVRKAVDEAETLLRDRQFDAAVKVLEAAGRAVGDDAEIRNALKKAEEVRHAERDRRYIESELKHAQLFEEQGDIATGLKIIDGALRRSPKSLELLAARERLSRAANRDGTSALSPAAAAVPQGTELPRTSQPEPAYRELDKVIASRDARPKQKWWIYGIAAVALAGLAGMALWMRPAVISVSPEKLSFACQPGVSPAAQIITITGAADIAPPRSTASWVKVTPGPHHSGKAEFEVHVLPGKLAPGTYNELLTFSQDHQVAVNLVISQSRQGPVIHIQPASLKFSPGPEGVPGQNIVVTSSAAIPDPTPSEPWLTVKRHNLKAGKAEFLVEVSASGLQPGPHDAVLIFSEAQKVPVSLVIPGGPAIGVYPTFLSFSDDNTAQKVTYVGPGDIADPTPSETWLTVTRESTSPGKAEFLVKVSSSDLDPGKYHADLSFPAGKKVQVALTVPEDLESLVVKPDSLAFPSGGLQQTIRVTGPGDIPNPTVTDPWVKFTRRDLGAGIAEFDIQTSAARLLPGPHVAYVNFSATKKVRLVLTVTPGNAPGSR